MFRMSNEYLFNMNYTATIARCTRDNPGWHTVNLLYTHCDLQIHSPQKCYAGRVTCSLGQYSDVDC